MALKQIGLSSGESDEVLDSYKNVRSNIEYGRGIGTNLSDLGVAVVEEFHQLLRCE